MVRILFVSCCTEDPTLDAQVMPNAVVFSAVLHCYAGSPQHIFCKEADKEWSKLYRALVV
jgi:hypothetical protein